jgi:hypothetical protein
VENSTNSSEPQEQKSNDVMALVAALYDSREKMPMQAEPDEVDQAEG